MALLIGTDEAGYGPNLGPLLIVSTTWDGDVLPPQKLWDALAKVVTPKGARGEKRLHVADSKKVYSSGKSIAPLEQGVHAFLKLLDIDCSTLTSLGTAIAGPKFKESLAEVCNGDLEDLALPVAATPGDIETASTGLERDLAAASIRLQSVEAAAVFAPEFNQRVAVANSKGVVLSATTLELVRRAVDRHHVDNDDALIVCDKHGGRNRYDDVISSAFNDEFVFRLEEARAKSVYRLGALQFCFRTKAEELLPVAVASMVAKYVRELVMMQLNGFWQQHVTDLKPTKGYPEDAKRFWADIEQAVTELGIAKERLWRCR